MNLVTSARKLLELTLSEYTHLRGEYQDAIYSAVFRYLSGGGNIAGFENAMRIAVSEFFTEAANIGWDDGVGVSSGKYSRAGAMLSDSEASSLLSSLIAEEHGHIGSLASRFRNLRVSGDIAPEMISAEAQARADGYARTLDRIYANFKTLAAGGIMLTFDGEDGEESCSDCVRYKGKRHRAWWWVRNNAVPPNRDFECGGYKCFHYLKDDSGNLFTI